MAGKQFKIRTELAQRIEGVFMEEVEVTRPPVPQLAPERPQQRPGRIVPWTTGKMPLQERLCGCTKMCLTGRISGSLANSV